MPPKHVIIGEETHNRDPIKVGTVQPEALIIVLQAERRDPKNPDVIIGRANITHTFPREVDFDDKASVKALNKWRGQIFERAFKAKMERRWPYLEDEKNALCDILEEQLATPEVAGLLTNVDWELVSAQYNSHFEGVVQSAGELYAKVSYNGDNGAKISSGQEMKKDREAPVRTSTALRNQIVHFKDQRSMDLVRGAKGIKQEEEESAKVATDSKILPSKSSSTSEGSAQSPVKRIVLKNGNQRTVLTAKRANSDSDADDEKSPPTKKQKLSRPTSLRGGDGDEGDDGGMQDGYNPNFNYADDAPPLTSFQGRELPADSPFRLAVADNSWSPQALQDLKNAQRAHGIDPDQINIIRRIPDPPASPPNDKKRSRETEEDSDSNEEEQTQSPKKMKLSQHFPQVNRDPRLPPPNAQGRHPLPNSPLRPLTPLESQQAPLSKKGKKRSRFIEEDDDESQDEQDLSSKKVKREASQDLPPVSNTAHQTEAVMSQQARSSTPARSRLTIGKKGYETTARLPTIKDLLGEE